MRRARIRNNSRLHASAVTHVLSSRASARVCVAVPRREPQPADRPRRWSNMGGIGGDYVARPEYARRQRVCGRQNHRQGEWFASAAAPVESHRLHEFGAAVPRDGFAALYHSARLDVGRLRPQQAKQAAPTVYCPRLPSRIRPGGDAKQVAVPAIQLSAGTAFLESPAEHLGELPNDFLITF